MFLEATAGRVEGGAFLSIANSGALVPADAVPTLSEPFRGTGVGLGLSIARSVSVAHGTELEVRNQPGGGLSIRIVL